MSLIGIASKAKITTASLDSLIAGKVTTGVALRIGATSNSLQEFLDGATSIALASLIGCTSSSLQELRGTIGREGAIGLLLGLCIGLPD